MARILAIEDDLLFAHQLQASLYTCGFAVTLSAARDEGLRLLSRESFDLLLMDISLPDGNGLLALQQLRAHSRVPVMLMSASGDECERIAAFSGGADDYLAKPFSWPELRVRIEAILRRVAYERGQDDGMFCTALIFDARRCDVQFSRAWAELTSTEYRVLDLLWRHVGEPLSKPYLYQQVLHRAYALHDRSLDMHISHIRRKLQRLGCHDVRVDTVWGKGYMLIQRTGEIA